MAALPIMSIDKFGSHIFGKDNKFNLLPNVQVHGEKVLKIVDLSNVKLFYNLVLPFVGRYNPKEEAFELLQDKRVKYEFPIGSSIIIKAEFPKKEVHIKVNGETIYQPEGFELKRGDLISFHRNNLSSVPEFYGELLIKCLVEVEK